MRKRVTLLFFITVLTFPGRIYAQTDSLWTLQACVDYALEHNLEIRRQELSEQESQINLRESKWAFSPSLSASAGATGSTGRVLDPTTYQFVQTSYTANTSSSISGNVTIFEGGRKIYALRKSELGLKASLLDSESLRDNIKMNVIASFLDVLCAEEQKKSAESTVLKLEEQLKRSQIMFEAGSITESDVLQLNSQLFAARNDVASARNAYDMARLSLCNLLELEDYKSFSVCAPDEDYTQILLDVEKSVESTPDFKRAVLNSELSLWDERLSKAAMWPTLSLSVGYGTNYSDARKKMVQNPDGTISYEAYPFLQQYADNASAFASISLNIPILTGMRANSGVKRARLQVQKTELAVATVRKDIHKQILQAQIDFETASDKYKGAQEQLLYAEAAEKQICDKYNLGATDFNSWNTAVYELAVAKYNLSQARCTLMMKYEILKIYANR